MRNSSHSNYATMDKEHYRNTLRKKLIKIFSNGMGEQINWTFHATERLIERFGGQPTQSIVTALKLAIKLLHEKEAEYANTVAVDYSGSRVVVSPTKYGYAVVTVIQNDRFSRGYHYR